MRSHYVSQFIIKNFAKAINVFDMKTGQIDEKRRPNKVFWEKDKYPDYIEKGMQKFESRVSNILYTKLSNKDEVRLTRYELANLKIFLLICSVRTLKPSEFVEILNNIESINTVEGVIKSAYPHLKRNQELGLTNDEVYNRALEIFTSIKNIQEIPHHKLCTLEIYYWSLPFLYSFMVIWDADPSMEFVLSSSGMMSEYEGVHRTRGISLSKKSYLFEKMQASKDPDEKLFYANLIIQCEFMYENYDLFNIGSNRVLVNVNPFFWLYNDPKYQKPDIWPCIMPYKELFTPPDKEYKNLLFYMENDIFIYKPKKLDKIQTIYVNSIILSQSPTIIGFNEPGKIVDSVCYSFWEHVHFNSVPKRGITKKEVINNLIQNFKSSPLRKLSDYCEKKSRKTKVKLEQFFDMIVSWMLHDFKTNEYIYRYLLRMKDQIIYDKRLDFLGKGEKKIEYLQKHLDEILKHKN